MAEYNVEIKGLDRFRRALSQYPRIAGSYFAEAIANSAWIITRESKENAPVKTGWLQGSIYPTIGLDAAVVSPQAEYAMYVHEGTRYMKARPFLLRAMVENQQDVQDQFETALENTLDEIAKRS